MHFIFGIYTMPTKQLRMSGHCEDFAILFSQRLPLQELAASLQESRREEPAAVSQQILAIAGRTSSAACYGPNRSLRLALALEHAEIISRPSNDRRMHPIINQHAHTAGLTLLMPSCIWPERLQMGTNLDGLLKTTSAVSLMAGFAVKACRHLSGIGQGCSTGITVTLMAHVKSCTTFAVTSTVLPPWGLWLQHQLTKPLILAGDGRQDFWQEWQAKWCCFVHTSSG